LNPNKEKLLEHVEALGTTLGEELIRPTKLYVKTILDLKDKFKIKGISHITGGGFIENIPRMIPEGFRVKINKGTWPVLPIFKLLQRIGGIKERDIYNTFNMGIGMVLAVEKENAPEILNYLNKSEEQAYMIGEIVKGDAGVDLC
jgi:phosphoribosylformylglycinamidine cyclo-ligase